MAFISLIGRSGGASKGNTLARFQRALQAASAFSQGGLAGFLGVVYGIHGEGNAVSVRLVAITQPVGIDGITTPEQLITYCARVSNPSNQTNTETASRLLAYLVRHGHWSPFEMVSMTMEIIAPRDITRQIIRHRSFSFQEFSQRYAVPSPAEVRGVRLQAKSARQSSLPTEDNDLHNWWRDTQREVQRIVWKAYNDAIQKGVAREVARAILPEGLTQSRLYMTGTVRSWIHYCALRTKTDTQQEHREIAFAVERILLEQFPFLEGILNDGTAQT